jgi:putative transcriptional regulator
MSSSMGCSANSGAGIPCSDGPERRRWLSPLIFEMRTLHQTLTQVADHSCIWSLESARGHCAQMDEKMLRLRLKADGRIVELRDGREAPLVPVLPTKRPEAGATMPAVRDLRQRFRLTQAEFAAKLGVPLDTIRNWEQGKRAPRGPARALLAVIAHAPDTVFAALAS